MLHEYQGMVCSVDETFISVWSNGEWCYTGDEPEYMSDDYVVVCVGLDDEEETVQNMLDEGRV